MSNFSLKQFATNIRHPKVSFCHLFMFLKNFILSILYRWWNYLIAYNVSVVTIKTLIQLVGCLVLRLSLTEAGCTFIQVN